MTVPQENNAPRSRRKQIFNDYDQGCAAREKRAFSDCWAAMHLIEKLGAVLRRVVTGRYQLVISRRSRQIDPIGRYRNQSMPRNNNIKRIESEDAAGARR